MSYPPDTSLTNGLVTDSSETMTKDDARKVVDLGKEFTEFAASVGVEGPWMLISGKFLEHDPLEDMVLRSCMRVFNYPNPEQYANRTINLLLDSPGGSLDGAFRTVLYLHRYAKYLDVYVPDRAKSASTLIALSARTIYMSPFGELGPLDTQIHDPRDPGTDISALDCYQSVDYVREFGFGTMEKALSLLSDKTRGQIALSDLLETASDFAIGAITPMLEGVRALDFGTWGRSLKIGEEYARRIVKAQNPDEARAKRIASSLVYGYTHHPFPIDIDEAVRLKLRATLMKEEIYQRAREIVKSCHKKIFVDFISEKEAADESKAPAEEELSDTQGEGTGGPVAVA